MTSPDVLHASGSCRSQGVPPIPRDDFAISESNHRIANNLTLLVSSLSIRASDVARHPRDYSGGEVGLMLGEISARIASVAWLHRFLSQRPDAECLDLNDYLHDLCEGLVEALADPDRVKLVRTGTGECVVRSVDVIPLCLIVTEAVTNALKYAHPAGVHGKLSVGCRSGVDGGLIVEVADDGVGLPEDFDPATGGGIGTRTIRVLARQLEATTEYVSEPCGLTFRLRLPARLSD